MDNVVEVEQEKAGSFIVCFDPLDGSNNIDCLASIGSIFAIYRRLSVKGRDAPNLDDVLQPGRQLVSFHVSSWSTFTLEILIRSQPDTCFMGVPLCWCSLLAKECKDSYWIHQ